MKQSYTHIKTIIFNLSIPKFNVGFNFTIFLLSFLKLSTVFCYPVNGETNIKECFLPSPLNNGFEKYKQEDASLAVCSITEITFNVTSCDPDNNIYSVSGDVIFTDKPASGSLIIEIDGSTFDVSVGFAFSPRFYAINNLMSDGATKTITAYFTADPSCTFSVNYTAPSQCNAELHKTLCSGGDLALNCEGTCPSPYPDVASNLAYTGVDNNYSVFIGGDLNITGGRELEGRGFVYGDFNYNAPGTNYNTGFVGVGSGVAPADNTYWLTIGGDLNFNGTYLLASQGASAEGIVAVKGSASDNDFFGSGNGRLARTPNLDLSVFDDCFATINTQSQCWAAAASSTNGTYVDAFGTFTFTSTNAASGLYVFNVAADMDPGYGGSVDFQNFPNDATILINVDKPGSPDNITLNIGAFTNVSDELRQRIIWNFPDASIVTLKGWSQFLGSIVVPSRTSLVDMTEVPGFNGRIIVGGDVTQVASGSEYHCYSFEGDLSTLGCSAAPPSCSLTDAGKTLEDCNNNGTNSDPSDDYITFSLNPTGTNLGATYAVTADNGGTVTLAGGGAATGVSYGSATAFRLQNASADGTTTYTITITDASGSPCEVTTTVMQNSCSNTCTNPIITALTNETICDGESFSTANVTTSETAGVTVTYQWFNNNGTDNANTNPISGETTASLTNLPTAVGSYSYQIVATSTADNSCMAAQTVNLVINPNSADTETYIGCEGDNYSIDVNGTTYNQANPTGIETLTNSVGCDSLVTINLTFNALPTLTIDNIACDADLTTYTIDFASNGTVTSDVGVVSGNQVTDVPVGTSANLTATSNGCIVQETVVSSICEAVCPSTKCVRVIITKK